jgi:hypothetical protein
MPSLFLSFAALTFAHRQLPRRAYALAQALQRRKFFPYGSPSRPEDLSNIRQRAQRPMAIVVTFESALAPATTLILAA